jgi:hypothetical protein
MVLILGKATSNVRPFQSLSKELFSQCMDTVKSLVDANTELQ